MEDIVVAKSAGFCFGVNRALKIVYKLLDSDKQVYTLGPIIHNPQMVQELKDRGVIIADNPEDVSEKNSVLVIRSHGVPLSILNKIDNLKINVENATCPFVSKIHDIVNKNDDSIILIAGNPNHPEVEGIKGHCITKSYVFNDNVSLKNLIESKSDIKNGKIIVVAQTTFSVNEWNKCVEIIKKECTNATVFDTICSATARRQSEAIELSQKSDMMIVIGGKQSSNTAKLASVCKENCETFLVETVADLPLNKIKEAKFIGVTAGASTPDGIIKEAISKMLEEKKMDEEVETNAEGNEKDFEQMLEESLKGLNSNSRVKGTVVNITPTEVFVDVGRKQAGFVPANELSNEPIDNIEDVIKVGDVLDLLIMKTNDVEGTIMLSKKRVDALKIWDEFKAAIDSKEIFTGKATDVIKGGVIVRCKGQKVFVPASLATLSRKDSLDQLKNKEVELRIVEVNENRRRAVGSIKSVLKEHEAEKLQKFWDSIEEGQKIEGTVKSLTSYGAFVDIGGVDGLLHISELSWERVKHPSDVLKVGQKINVYVKSLDKENGKISLGHKDPNANPWETLKKDYPEGSIVEVDIVGLTSFGAFGKVIPGIDGLIHISQISDKRIDKPQDVLKVGDKVMAMITSIDFDDKRVSLSIRRLLEDDPKFAGENEKDTEDKENPVDEVAISDNDNITFTTDSNINKTDEQLEEEAKKADMEAVEKAIQSTEE